MSLNRDLSPPLGDPSKLPVNLAQIFDKTLKAYWLDGQILNEDNLEYTFDESMPKFATLHIPKVVRFIHTYNDDKDIAGDWCGAGVGGQGCQNKTWIRINQQVDDPPAYLWPVDTIYPTLTSGGYVLSEMQQTNLGAIAHRYGGSYGQRSDGLPMGSIPIPDELVNGITVTYFYYGKDTGQFICWDDIPFNELVLF